ncbi:MAG: hypothetical protein E7614_07345 [Ruminococcaceae bacterium]|nr:hypothetical protein [Oscillospiraceae bacterium]
MKLQKNFYRLISFILVLTFVFSFTACTAGTDESSLSESSADSSSVVESQSSTAEESTDSSETTESSEEESSVEASESESSEIVSSMEEPSSEDDSSVEENSSEASASSEEPSSGDISVLNPYYGTDIKPVEGKVIAFTFDDGPSYTGSTNKILDKLEELGMKATFFMVGERVSSSAAPTIKRMIELGCDIGNHSYNHPNFNKMTYAEVQKQIDDTNTNLFKHTGVKATLIRPPYGNITENQMANLHTPIICWDIDSKDWEFRSNHLKTHSSEQIAQMIYDYTIKQVHSGGIVLMHDIYDTTADAFCMLADELVAQGYTLVSISELLGTEKLMCTTIKYGFKW